MRDSIEKAREQLDALLDAGVEEEVMREWYRGLSHAQRVVVRNRANALIASGRWLHNIITEEAGSRA